jgi:hypothetical protein
MVFILLDHLFQQFIMMQNGIKNTMALAPMALVQQEV